LPPAISGIPVTCIGEIKHAKKVSMISETEKRSALDPQGWQHFRDQ
jgi:thiamine monophosphate kinase